MRLLWDTHTYLWFSEASIEISDKLKGILLDDNTENYLSIISIWEITIKSGLGKLTIDGSLNDIWNDIINNGIKIIPMDIEHLKLYENLYFHHRDPFDRMIASIAIYENMNLVGKDNIFDLYFDKTNVSRIW